MAQDLARIGHSTNLVGIPTGLLASTAFNEHPLPLHISGTREANYGLFQRLRETADQHAAAAVFQEYMYLVFGLQGGARENEGPRRFHSSYLKLLSGWGFDSNNPQGAVLKGWVESRFGLLPTYHKQPLKRFSSPAWMGYIEEKMSSRFHNNSINLQLDLLYEFSQWAIVRFGLPGRRHVTLYRGENHFEEQRQIGPREGRWMTVRLNNLVSFTANRETACEFGDFILEVQVPVVKILFFNNLLPRHSLNGEWEYLAIGGEYRVRASYY